jgi:hypothetical protein
MCTVSVAKAIILGSGRFSESDWQDETGEWKGRRRSDQDISGEEEVGEAPGACHCLNTLQLRMQSTAKQFDCNRIHICRALRVSYSHRNDLVYNGRQKVARSCRRALLLLDHPGVSPNQHHPQTSHLLRQSCTCSAPNIASTLRPH